MTAHESGRAGRVAMRTLLLIAGAYHVALGLFMVVAPKTFFEQIGPFGPYNDHYVRDTATFYAALGIVMLVALVRVRWRVPVLAFAVLQYGLHVLNHVWDVGDADPGWLGPADIAALALIGAVLWWLMRDAERPESR